MLSPSPLVNALFVLIFLVFIAGWTWALMCLKHGRPLLVTEPRPLPATNYDTLMHVLTLGWMLVVFVVAVVIAANFITVRANVGFSEMTPQERIAVVRIDMIGKIVALLAAVPLVLLRFAPRWGDLKPKWHKLPVDFVIGFVGFCMLAVPVLFLQVILTMIWPEKHPFIEVIQNDPDPQFLLVAALSAVLLAPVAEEFFFRVLLQGLLERLSMRPGWQLLVDTPPEPLPTPGQDLLPGEHHADDLAAPIDFSRPPGATETLPPVTEVPPHEDPAYLAMAVEENPFASPQSAEIGEPPVAATRLATVPAYWPIIASSLIFALAHLGQGPAPISLFVFALGLGYVYRATHRVLPCILIHFFLNGFSMLQLWLMT